MTENQATSKLVQLLKPHGFFWKCADRFTAGIPDIIGCYLGRFIAIEMKIDSGKPTSLQIYNMKQIVKNTGYVAIITYSNKQHTWTLGDHTSPSASCLMDYLLYRMKEYYEN